MTARTILTMVDGVRVAVLDSLDQITTYVLREQGDWFEDEIRFLRRVLQPGQQMIDIGANCGVYALSLAKVVGPNGRVWAFEPSSATADLLAEGIVANGFAHVCLERCAVSAAPGTAQFSMNVQPELNALSHGGAVDGSTETVTVTSLDDCLTTRGWRDIAFLKIDAEGEEAPILAGGRRFFAEQSPLVQYELQRDGEMQMELVDAFAALGYDSYRLVPGLGILVPFSRDSTPDAFHLNLFGCKPDRAARLAAAGFLVEADAVANSQEWFKDVAGRPGALEAYSWRHTLATLPYGAAFAADWERTMATRRDETIDDGLAFHAYSRDPDVLMADRFVALTVSMFMFQKACDSAPSGMRLASLARTARELGIRTVAIESLMQLTKVILQDQSIDPSEPFLAPGERFDRIPPGNEMGNWILAGVLEELEISNSWSSYYRASPDRLRMIRDLGFASEEMLRRLALVEERHERPGRQPAS
jgi:FkbM family methyltransferase